MCKRLQLPWPLHRPVCSGGAWPHPQGHRARGSQGSGRRGECLTPDTRHSRGSSPCQGCWHTAERQQGAAQHAAGRQHSLSGECVRFKCALDSCAMNLT